MFATDIRLLLDAGSPAPVADWGLWQVIPAFLSFLAAALYTVFAMLQWRAIRRQADIASDQPVSMKAQEGHMAAQLDVMREQAETMRQALLNEDENVVAAKRAYLTAHIKDFFYDGGTGWGQVLLEIRNSGETIANDVAVCLNTLISNVNPPGCRWSAEPEAVDIGECISVGVVNPANPLLHPTRFDSFSAEQATSYHAGKQNFYCWGTIRYRDVFLQRRLSDFAFEFTSDHLTGRACEFGNSAF